MTNGLNININETEFKSKPPEERDWMLFQAASSIEQHGCSFGRKTHQTKIHQQIIIAAGAFGAAAATVIGFFRYILCLILIFGLVAISSAAMTGKDAHERYLYPVVRVSTGTAGGSGTIIYSKASEGKWSNYVLTNFHVIEDAIKVEDDWDSKLQKKIKKERRSLVYAEIFKYKDLSIPIGTMKVEADIVTYNRQEDMALLKLRLDEQLPNVTILPLQDKVNAFHVFDETVAVGASLGFPPIPTPGILTRLNYQIDSLAYHMSSSQIVYGNSGGAMFLADGTLIGIPSLVPVIGWGTPISHMGLFIPISRIYKWFEDEDYHFIFDRSRKEKDCLNERDAKIKKAKKEGVEE